MLLSKRDTARYKKYSMFHRHEVAGSNPAYPTPPKARIAGFFIPAVRRGILLHVFTRCIVLEDESTYLNRY